MLQSHIETLVDWGVDYVTATCNEKSLARRIGTLAELWLASEQAAGNTVREWSGYGYFGLASGSVQFGSRADSVLVRVTGPSAQTKVGDVLRLATNVSRIDCQSTVRLVDRSFKLAEYVERRARRVSRAEPRPFAVRLLRDSMSGNTVYLGRRMSDRFIRIYDKGTESKESALEGCWRAEVQYNNRAAMQTAMAYQEHNLDHTWIISRVSSELCRRGIFLA